MDPLTILKQSMSSGADSTKIRRAFKAGFTVNAIMYASGLSREQVYIAIESMYA